MNTRAVCACLSALAVHGVQAQPLIDGAVGSGRDPFSPPLASRGDDAVGPLQRIPLRQLELAAVMSAGGMARALLQDGAGTGYIVVVGSLVGDQGGRVTAIEPGRVVVEAGAGPGRVGQQTVLDLHDGSTSALEPGPR